MLKDGTYNIDTDASNITWVGRKKVIETRETGTIDLHEGVLVIEDGKPVSGSFTVDMASINANEGGEKLENHLKSEDFFEVETYPEATFNLLESTAHDEDKFTVRGNLNIKGETREVSFTATIKQDGDTLRGHAEFVIDRSKWKVKYGSESFFKNLGDKAIENDIELTIDLSAKKSS